MTSKSLWLCSAHKLGNDIELFCELQSSHLNWLTPMKRKKKGSTTCLILPELHGPWRILMGQSGMHNILEQYTDVFGKTLPLYSTSNVAYVAHSILFALQTDSSAINILLCVSPRSQQFKYKEIHFFTTLFPHFTHSDPTLDRYTTAWK